MAQAESEVKPGAELLIHGNGLGKCGDGYACSILVTLLIELLHLKKSNARGTVEKL